MQVTVPKIGSGTQDDPYRPDTTAVHWTMISQTETTVTIDIVEQ